MRYKVGAAESQLATIHVDRPLPAVNLRGSVTESAPLKAALEAVPGVDRVRCCGRTITAEISPLFEPTLVARALVEAASASCGSDRTATTVEFASIRLDEAGPDPESEAPLEPGVTVKLRSGGRVMTLGALVRADPEYVKDPALARCYWHPGDNPDATVQQVDIPLAALVRVGPGSSGDQEDC